MFIRNDITQIIYCKRSRDFWLNFLCLLIAKPILCSLTDVLRLNDLLWPGLLRQSTFQGRDEKA